MGILNIILSTSLLLIPHKVNKHPHFKVNKKNVDVVTVTTYKVNEFKNDINGDLTATGIKLDTVNPRKHRIIAISWDLKKRYKFGQKVFVLGAGIYSGTYYVQDLMNKRWRKRIDILINPEDIQMKYKKVRLYKL
jgi:3D (Asp-Asp-Asp) domain-containing protein